MTRTVLPMTHSDSVTIRELTDEESRELLARNHVGRIAFSFHDRVDIRPIHYVYSDNWLYGRTSPTDKLVTLQHNQWLSLIHISEAHETPEHLVCRLLLV